MWLALATPAGQVEVLRHPDLTDMWVDDVRASGSKIGCGY